MCMCQAIAQHHLLQPTHTQEEGPSFTEGPSALHVATSFIPTPSASTIHDHDHPDHTYHDEEDAGDNEETHVAWDVAVRGFQMCFQADASKGRVLLAAETATVMYAIDYSRGQQITVLRVDEVGGCVGGEWIHVQVYRVWVVQGCVGHAQQHTCVYLWYCRTVYHTCMPCLTLALYIPCTYPTTQTHPPHTNTPSKNHTPLIPRCKHTLTRQSTNPAPPHGGSTSTTTNSSHPVLPPPADVCCNPFPSVFPQPTVLPCCSMHPPHTAPPPPLRQWLQHENWSCKPHVSKPA